MNWIMEIRRIPYSRRSSLRNCLIAVFIGACLSASLLGASCAGLLDTGVAGKTAAYTSPTDNASWPLFRRDLQHTARARSVGSRTGRLAWSYEMDSEIANSPVIGSEGTVYVGTTRGIFYAVSASGKLKWSSRIGQQVAASAAIGSDGTVYVPNSDGKVFAFYANGKLKWSYNIGDMAGAPPTVAPDGTVYVGSDELYALDASGTLKWSYKTARFVDSCPAIGTDGTIYVSTLDNHLLALNRNGTLKWSLGVGDTSIHPRQLRRMGLSTWVATTADYMR